MAQIINLKDVSEMRERFSAYVEDVRKESLNRLMSYSIDRIQKAYDKMIVPTVNGEPVSDVDPKEIGRSVSGFVVDGKAVIHPGLSPRIEEAAQIYATMAIGGNPFMLTTSHLNSGPVIADVTGLKDYP